MAETNCVGALNPDHMIEEIKTSIRAGDAIKVRLVLDCLRDVDRTSQNRLLYELSRADAEFAIPILNYLVTERSELCEPLPIIRESLMSQLIGHPELILRYLADPDIRDKKMIIETAGELRLEDAVPALIGILGETEQRDTIKLVISTLGLIGGTQVISTLTEYLYSADRELTVQAIYALQQVGTTTAMHWLADRMGTDSELDLLILGVFGAVQDHVSISKLNDVLHSPHTRMRGMAKELMERLGEKAVPFLIENLKEADVDFVIHSLNVLGSIGDAHSVAPIRRLLASEPEDANVRFSAYETLAMLPLQKGAYALAAGLTDREDHVCIAAARAIERNLSDLLVTGIRNLVRNGDEDARHIVKTVVNAQTGGLFLALTAEEFFQRQALVYLPHVHQDVREFYLQLLRDHGLDEFAQRVACGRTGLGASSRAKICAVDDSRVVLSIYRSTLHDLGFEPILFEFPSSALEWLEEEKPALVLTDLNMPKISGIELAQKIREKYPSEELPIIMVTTQSDARDQCAAEAAGVNDVLSKPFDAETLRAAMERYIPVP